MKKLTLLAVTAVGAVLAAKRNAEAKRDQAQWAEAVDSVKRS